MSIRPILRAVAISLVVLIAVFLVLFLYETFAVSSARGEANALCKSIPLGTSAREARNILVNAGTDPRWRETALGDEMWAGYRGAWTERWACSVTIVRGRVAGHEIRMFE